MKFTAEQKRMRKEALEAEMVREDIAASGACFKRLDNDDMTFCAQEIERITKGLENSLGSPECVSRQEYFILCAVSRQLHAHRDISKINYDPCQFCCLKQAEKAGQLASITTGCGYDSYYIERPDQRWANLHAAWDAIQD